MPWSVLPLWVMVMASLLRSLTKVVVHDSPYQRRQSSGLATPAQDLEDLEEIASKRRHRVILRLKDIWVCPFLGILQGNPKQKQHFGGGGGGFPIWRQTRTGLAFQTFTIWGVLLTPPSPNFQVFGKWEDYPRDQKSENVCRVSTLEGTAKIHLFLEARYGILKF